MIVLRPHRNLLQNIVVIFQKDSIQLFRKPFRNLLKPFRDVLSHLKLLHKILSQAFRNMSCNFLKQPFRKYFQNSFKNILKTFHKIFRLLKHFPKTLSKDFRKLSCIFLGKVSKIFQEIFLNVYCKDI